MSDTEEMVGKKAKVFCLPDKTEKKICLKDFLGKWVVLYFYPKDNTPGCTTEACDFNSEIPDFSKLDAMIVGVSPDSPKSHEKFSMKYNLDFPLLCDEEHIVLEKYGVWQLKKNYGKEYMGVVRSTFLIDPQGVIRFVWRKVKVKGHVDEVKEKLKELS